MTARQARTQRRAAERQSKKTATQHDAPLETVSLNLFEYGFPSNKLVLEGEDPAKLDQLRASLRADHQPANITEEILVDEIAQHFWRLRRMRYFETHTMLPENIKQWLPYLPMFQRTMAAAERGMHKSLAALTRLQKDRGFVPAKSQPAPAQAIETGFVFTKSRTKAEGAAAASAVEAGFVPAKSPAKPEPAAAPVVEIGFVPQNGVELPFETTLRSGLEHSAASEAA